MAKANKGVFSALKQDRQVSYEIGKGEKIDLVLNTLTLGDIVAIDDTTDTKEKFEIILRSLKGNLPDLTIDDVMEIPVSIVEDLIDDICEFNGIDKPDKDTDGDDGKSE